VSVTTAAHRPVFGYGPGRFFAAVEPRSTRKLTPGGVRSWSDGHNFLITELVGTGLLGLLALLAWLGASARRASGPLAGFALILGLSALVEPLAVGVTPLALLALGAAQPEWHGEPRRWRSFSLATAGVLALAGCVAGVEVLGGVALMYRSVSDTSVSDARTASRLLRPWPDPLFNVALIENHFVLHTNDPVHRVRALAAAREATVRDPSLAPAWSQLGSLQYRYGMVEEAAVSYARALRAGPWFAQGLQGQISVAVDLGDTATARRACGRMRALGLHPDGCPPATGSS
jgi:hypothetical protein